MEHDQGPAVHPGPYIKEQILPAELSIKKAAEMLGVGRPALSNLLNGNAALSAEMAKRIEKAFDADATELLEKQARYDEFELRESEHDIAVRAFTRAYWHISADQIEGWSKTIAARAELPALLRQLVNSTGSNLSKVDFPAFDNSQKRGWDGRVTSGSVTPWIPRGESGWEFGCSRDATTKANSDYQIRTRTVPLKERKETTFVFVTPTNWPRKGDWAKEKRAREEWKNVVALDASDLEQWLEQSVPAQVRFREFLGAGRQDARSLSDVWEEWSAACEPVLTKGIFSTAVERHRDALKRWFDAPPDRPFVVAADSRLEALAFVACALEDFSDSTLAIMDRAVVIQTLAAFNEISRITSDFVPVIGSSDVEQALAGLHSKTHTLIVRSRNTSAGDADIQLELLGGSEFENALKGMGLTGHRIEQLARESARSPTILRRRLAQVPAVKVPVWSGDSETARRLIPMVFVGAWDSGVTADREILECLSRTPYDEVERTVAELRQLEEPPVWSIGRLRGVVSKIDALFTVHNSITGEDLEDFLFAAEVVLSEADPALDLPPDKRWAADLYGKSRNHSATLRNSLCDTLALIAVHGSPLFTDRLGLGLQAMVGGVIRKLLTPTSAETWQSQKDDLPYYAEAAPETFMTILEEDLNSPDPTVAILLTPASTGIFGDCPRTGLLWSLESLAWKPEWLTRVVLILAKLCRWKLDDNWANKPIGTLESIFRCWMPQTAASVAHRNRTLETLARRYPEVGWQICIEQFNPASTVGDYSYRPRWRDDAYGFGEPVLNDERVTGLVRAIELALNWPTHDEHTLGDLVERLAALRSDHSNTVWDLIEEWVGTNPTEHQAAALREKVRRSALTRRSQRRRVDEDMVRRARQAYELLESNDPVVRHRWLFLNQWVEESADELADSDLDFDKRQERIAQQRRDALREVLEAQGIEGIEQVCAHGNASQMVGWHLTEIIQNDDEIVTILGNLLANRSEENGIAFDGCISGVLAMPDENRFKNILSTLLDRVASDALRVQLLKCAPFDNRTWQFVDSSVESVSQRYWQEVHPWVGRHDRVAAAKVIDELLAKNRPRAAFNSVRMDLDVIDTDRLVQLLTDVATKALEPAGEYRVDSYYVSKALDTLEKRGDVARGTLARLEFMFVEALSHSKHGIRNLEAELSETPHLFMQALALVFKRSDGVTDPPTLGLPAPRDRGDAVASAAYSLLTQAGRIPGTQPDGTIDLKELREWVREVRSLCQEYARVDIGDQMIGHILSHSPKGADGVWPCEQVREILDEIGSTHIGRGINMGRRNARGATWRGDGGTQERALAAEYRAWAQNIAFDYPCTADVLEQLAQSYDHEAASWDADAEINDRLRI